MMIKECFILGKQTLFHGATLWNNLKKVQKYLFWCLSTTYTPKYSSQAELITRRSYYYQQALEYIRRWLWEETITKFIIIIIIIRSSSSLQSEDFKKAKRKQKNSKIFKKLLQYFCEKVLQVWVCVKVFCKNWGIFLYSWIYL